MKTISKPDGPTEEQIAKLPEWARVYIAQLRRKLAKASEYADSVFRENKDSPYFTTQILCYREQNRVERRYLGIHNVSCESAGVVVSLYADQEWVSVRFNASDNTARAYIQPESANSILIRR